MDCYPPGHGPGSFSINLAKSIALAKCVDNIYYITMYYYDAPPEIKKRFAETQKTLEEFCHKRVKIKIIKILTNKRYPLYNYPLFLRKHIRNLEMLNIKRKKIYT